MDCRVPQSCGLVMERPGPSSLEIMSPENIRPVSGKVLDGRDGLLGCLPVAGWDEISFTVGELLLCVATERILHCHTRHDVAHIVTSAVWL
jgi:hypothetical protein